MLQTLEQTRNVIEKIEQQASLASDNIIDSTSSVLYLDSASKSAMLFTRVELGVQIKVSETKQDAVNLIDEIAHELWLDGYEIDIERFNSLEGA